MSILNLRRKDTSLISAITPSTSSGTDDGVNNARGSLGLNLLYSPSKPFIDFIFVHGLAGGSRKTWSRTSSVTHYWPQEWLPKDPAFKNVRVHSFGYDTDWAKGKDNCLNIHHIGKSLLGEMSTSPYLTDTNGPIVLIGHSMGGLVIKKAYMLAKQGAAYETLAARFHTIYFLATPHRGSDSAKFLNNILQMANASRAYVADLERGSGTIQSINDEFRNYSADLDLWSFYETQKLKVGVSSKLIVDPESATLGYREEMQMPMNADHRSICKFETPTDPNYQVLRNALASTVQNISNLVLKSQEKLRQKEVDDLRLYLEVPEDIEDGLITIQDARMSGTCEWFSAKDSYLDWAGFAPEAPDVFWVTGRPASGKSVLAGYIIGQLQETNIGCSYFFFKHGDKSKSRLSACLRSLAFQMACTNTQVRDTLLEMKREGAKFDNDNVRTVWRRLFLCSIFQTQFPRQYWVIDALDECQDFAPLLDLMLGKLDESTPLRILITSREIPELENCFSRLGVHRAQHEVISSSDTLADVKVLVEAKAKSVCLQNDDDRAALVENVLKKSEGCFLWTVLVLSKLSNLYGEEEIKQALEEIPRDMIPLYQRILAMMTHAVGGKKLAKAILTWATCSTRPLTTRELTGALKIDLKDNFPRLEESILAVCGHLVTVDKFGRVQLVHGTAREFLLNEDLESEFAIDKTEAHTRLARACLTYLTGEEMKPPRTSRRGSANDIAGKRAAFSAYACAAFSYHLARADPLANDVMDLVDKFLKTNVLSWIEVIARTHNLIHLIRAAKDLGVYLNACAAERSPLDRSMQTIRGWTTDLVRVVAKFADALATSPSAIYSLVLPLCPTESMIHKIGNPRRRLSVVGLSNFQWDDRLSCIDFYGGRTSAVCYGDNFLAVGLNTGTIALYHAASYQQYKVLNHGEAVKFLQFQGETGLMASCGMKTIRIWDIHGGEITHSFRSLQRFIGLAFDKNLLLAASSKNYLASWDLENDGAPQLDRPWSYFGEQMNIQPHRTPCAISIAVDHKMLAVAYSERPITLWDLEGNTCYGGCGKKLASGETSTHMVTALVFNPNPNIGLLAASYLDGELVLLDPFSDQELESFRAGCQTLAASPDGRLLAGSAGGGIIQIYEFGTLTLLYRVTSSNFYIRQLAFSRDSLRVSDVRGSQCNVWEPVVLLRDSVNDHSSDATLTPMVDVVASDAKVKISAIVLHPKGDFVFCGKDDGSVTLHDLKTGAEVRTLYRHKALVRILCWWSQSDRIMSVDASNAILMWTLKRSEKEGWVVETIRLQARLDCGHSIIEVLQGEASGKFILSTRTSDHLWSINGQQEDARIHSDRPGIRKWIQHQQSALHMICVDGAAARIYTWRDWSEVGSVLFTADVAGLQLKGITPSILDRQRRIIIELSELDGSPATRGLHLIDATSLCIENFPANEVRSDASKLERNADEAPVTEKGVAISIPLLGSQLAALARCVAHVVGLGDVNQLVFLDNHSWVCSVDLERLNESSISYFRHFFVPYDWFAGTRDLMCAVVQRDVLFVRYDNVAIIKGGLECIEEVSINV